MNQTEPTPPTLSEAEQRAGMQQRHHRDVEYVVVLGAGQEHQTLLLGATGTPKTFISRTQAASEAAAVAIACKGAAFAVVPAKVQIDYYC